MTLKEISEFGSVEILARQMVEGFITGLHRSPFHGFSVEFAEHRLYNPGESTKHIDWKVYAKTDRLYIKQYEEETNLRCQIVLDTSSSMYYPEDHGKLRFATMASAAIAYMLQKQRDAVSLCTFDEQIQEHTPCKSTALHLHKIFTLLNAQLDKPKSSRPTHVAHVLHQVAQKIHKRSLVVIFSDMLDKEEELEELFTALQHLKHNKHEIIIFHVVDRITEQNFEWAEKPYEFVDLESGEKLKLRPNQVREMYTSKIKDYYKALKMKCGQYKVDFVEVDISMPFEQVLHAYLIKRKKTRL